MQENARFRLRNYLKNAPKLPLNWLISSIDGLDPPDLCALDG
jgi:hypothetical protein